MNRLTVMGLPNVGLVLYFGFGYEKYNCVMERHSGHCKAGFWNVLVMPNKCYGHDFTYDAVMDDFGNLVRVN